MFKSKFMLPQEAGNVYTVEDYKALPKEKRELNGWYLVPFSLQINIGDLKKKESEWDKFYAFVRQEYFFQWVFRYWLTSWDNPVYAFYRLNKMRFDEKYYAVKRWFKPFFPRWRASCKRHQYTDIVQLSVSSNFALIQDYWHEEVAKDTINWNADGHHKQFYKELKAAIKYIEIDRKKLEEKADNALTTATLTKRKGTFQERYGKHNKLEQEIKDRDTDVIVWFIQNRDFFWT